MFCWNGVSVGNYFEELGSTLVFKLFVAIYKVTFHHHQKYDAIATNWVHIVTILLYRILNDNITTILCIRQPSYNMYINPIHM